MCRTFDPWSLIQVDLILDSWSLIPDPWSLIPDPWSLILDPWFLILDPWSSKFSGEGESGDCEICHTPHYCSILLSILPLVAHYYYGPVVVLSATYLTLDIDTWPILGGLCVDGPHWHPQWGGWSAKGSSPAHPWTSPHLRLAPSWPCTSRTTTRTRAP